MSDNNKLLRIEDLRLYFRVKNGVVQAVDKIDFSLNYNEAIVIVGESGCGKTSFAKSVLRLLPRNVDTYSGRIYLDNIDIMTLSDEEFRQNVRWVQMSMVPQAAMNALNPVIKIGEQVSEPLIIHQGMGKDEAWVKALEMIEHMGVPGDFLNRYPFELSGGMRQRIALAMALVTSPLFVFLDEPTSALDVLTQANIFNVLKRLKKELMISFILITHDVATSSEIADRVAVMYAGQIVEIGHAKTFFSEPLHPYSEMLMNSVPRLRVKKEPSFIKGQPPSLLGPPTGCRFAERCPKRFNKCSEEPPVVETKGHQVKCWLYA
ncbi:MAG: ATP-binding cassette domain-containing protein [Anaerolineales bacterium]|nr:ATP-binding cassette domain-containing protein [Anaerolineales bacterium]